MYFYKTETERNSRIGTARHEHETNPRLAAWPIKRFLIGGLGNALSLDGNFTALRNSDFAGSLLFSLGRRRVHLYDSRACIYFSHSNQQISDSEHAHEMHLQFMPYKESDVKYFA